MTTTPQPFYVGETNLLNPDNHVLVLIDHQPAQVAVTGSHDRTLLINNVVGLAKFAKIFGIPTLLTTVVEALGGKLLQPIQDVFPDQVPIDRTTLNSWEDPRVVDWVRQDRSQEGGHRRVVDRRLRGVHRPFRPRRRVRGLRRHRRLRRRHGRGSRAGRAADNQAGAVPLTSGAYGSELQRHWDRSEHADELRRLVAEHGGAYGSSFAWEMQLLATPTPEWLAAPAG